MGFSRTPVAALAGLALAAALVIARPAAAATWYESYDEAEKAIAGEDWSGAVRHLNAALAARPSSGANVRTYGMRFIDYFPYLKLGIAYFHLGQNDAALQAFETEQRQGEVDKSATARALLASYRERIVSGAAEQRADRERRAPALVAESLRAARRLEEQRRFEDALAALAPALAIAPENPEALEARRRLLAAVAGDERRKSDEERRAQRIAQGQEALAAGRFRQAAASFGEALDPGADEETRALLEQAQARLRAEIGSLPTAAKLRSLVETGLSRALELERAGELERALGELQAVLALEPRNARALELQHRLLSAQGASEASGTRSAAVAQLVAEAELRLAAGDYESALRAANRVLALEPAHGAALRQIAQAYGQLSDALLEPDRSPPSILLDDRSAATADGPGDSARVAVRSGDVELRGTVYDRSPVEVRFLVAGGPAGEAEVAGREFQGVWITDFRWRHRLPAGVTTVEVVALDRAGNRATLACRVDYEVPFVRSAGFLVALAVALGAGLAAWPVARARRRRRRQRDRFNPYVAGAPILEHARFFGRQQLLEYVLRRVPNNSLMLYGERRIGKTSFQHELKRTLSALDDPDHEFYPVFIDLQGTPQEKFFGTLAAEIFHELAPKLDGIQPSAPPGQDSYGYPELLKDLQRVLKALRERTRKRVKLVLLIDEVDELNDYDPRVNQRLRSLFMRAFADSLVAVVSGVSIKKHWEREGSPWYNFFQEIEVKPLDRDEARALIEAPVRGMFRFEEGVADEIIRRTGAKPYLIQRLCSGLVDRLHQERRASITRADVETACRVEGI